ncbi:hypothetical protein HAX54_048896, partial [Datura stramonium]|nr:hypothetical protein [Datura stramonium]
TTTISYSPIWFDEMLMKCHFGRILASGHYLTLRHIGALRIAISGSPIIGGGKLSTLVICLSSAIHQRSADSLLQFASIPSVLL